MTADPIADVLRVTAATSIVSGGIAAGGRWSLKFPRLDQIVFAAIIRGGCWLRLDGRRAPVRLEAGDVGLLSGRVGFGLCGDLRARPVAIAIDLADTWGEVTTIGDGADCMWLAGRVALDPTTGDVLVRSLPDLIHVGAAMDGAASMQWIVNELVEEYRSALPGAGAATAQLAQLFFVKILRAHIAQTHETPRGWLHALRDERISRALRVIHDEPSRPLVLDDLARTAGMSRTRFAVQFKAMVGTSPLAYATEWRMLLAKRGLRDGERTVEQLASELGYASASAFSIAFKRVTGSSPRDYRIAQRLG